MTASVFREDASRRLLHLNGDRRVKVVSGVRGAGKTVFKSTLMRQLPGSTMSFDFEGDLRNRDCLMVPMAVQEGGADNVFLDEPQGALGYTVAAESMLGDGVDVYVFASDVRAFEVECCEAVHFHPLSFREYHGASKGDRIDDLEGYLCGSSLPAVALSGKDEKGMWRMLRDSFEASLGDAAATTRRRLGEEVLLDLATFILGHCGDRLSMTGIQARLVTGDLRIEHAEMSACLDALEGAFLIRPVGTTDVSGNDLDAPPKYYAEDHGMGYLLCGGANASLGRAMQNAVYNELVRRGYEVTACLTDSGEIDFRAVRGGEVEFIQTALDVRDPLTLERKVLPLRSSGVRGKLLYANGEPSVDGVECVSVADWLIGDEQYLRPRSGRMAE